MACTAVSLTARKASLPTIPRPSRQYRSATRSSTTHFISWRTLVLDRKIVGMLRVANHERGYSCEQQEDLEVIMPVIVQALQRESSEKKWE